MGSDNIYQHVFQTKFFIVTIYSYMYVYTCINKSRLYWHDNSLLAATFTMTKKNLTMLEWIVCLEEDIGLVLISRCTVKKIVKS